MCNISKLFASKDGGEKNKPVSSFVRQVPSTDNATFYVLTQQSCQHGTVMTMSHTHLPVRPPFGQPPPSPAPQTIPPASVVPPNMNMGIVGMPTTIQNPMQQNMMMSQPQFNPQFGRPGLNITAPGSFVTPVAPTQVNIPGPQLVSQPPLQQMPQVSHNPSLIASPFQPQLPPQPPIAQPTSLQNNPYMGAKDMRKSSALSDNDDTLISRYKSNYSHLTLPREKLRLLIQQLDPLCSINPEAEEVRMLSLNTFLHLTVPSSHCRWLCNGCHRECYQVMRAQKVLRLVGKGSGVASKYWSGVSCNLIVAEKDWNIQIMGFGAQEPLEPQENPIQPTEIHEQRIKEGVKTRSQAKKKGGRWTNEIHSLYTFISQTWGLQFDVPQKFQDEYNLLNSSTVLHLHTR